MLFHAVISAGEWLRRTLHLQGDSYFMLGWDEALSHCFQRTTLVSPPLDLLQPLGTLCLARTKRLDSLDCTSKKVAIG
ncbi:hypothetical protein V1477_005323 [Vespula maculifrons]|uniref:Uncharacterized protein n=3 Tax=Vespula TaxID=7451 RepID=A0A834P9K0_VESPE|nr:hypothetical protein HZH66_001945 [Vespula vulgaris]KAF7434194.1 hypothetical protein H0235_002385 [Vespula pensylvanica]